jgi:hypothetical protein
VVIAHLSSVMSSAVLMALAMHTHVCVRVCMCAHGRMLGMCHFFMLMVYSQISSSLGMPCGDITMTWIQV